MSREAVVLFMNALKVMDGPRLDDISKAHYLRSVAEFTDEVIAKLIDALNVQFERRPSPARCRRFCVDIVNPVGEFPTASELQREIVDGIVKPGTTVDHMGITQYCVPSFSDEAKRIIAELGGYDRIRDESRYPVRDLRFMIDKVYKQHKEEFEAKRIELISQPALSVDAARALLDVTNGGEV